ncbi:MAG: adenosylcobalamin-dependent ribonucleoside-diphosphate reductase [Deltaproteobacteria bacterium]|nr:adenosylcobalamin-dependent ribonucleoside-diphosphate reductase [Deltaproteobacteria bacterium]
MAAELTPSARAILDRRYLARDGEGRIIETPEQLFRRVARAAAGAERQWGGDPPAMEELFFELLSSLEFLPNSPALRNAGREPGQLAACFVLPIEDSIGAIFDALHWAALVQVSGGGTGFDFSRLRHAGAPAGAQGGCASGPLPFLDLFHRATDALRPLAMRRGANMGVLRVDHPDIVAFVQAKLKPGQLTNFNLSVALTDEFMAELKAGGRFALRDPRTRAIVRRIDANTLFDLVTACAWECGDPGALFIDRIEAANPTPRLGRLTATNPCSEQPLLPFESCVLGSLDVSRFLRADERWPDWDRLRRAVDLAVRFLDDLIDAGRFPLPQIAEATHVNRKIGLGVMGFADLLIALEIPYDSDQALALADELMGFVERASIEASAQLAKERGAFPGFAGSLWDELGMPPLRNATTTTIAPTGTLSILAGCSSGIEPVFAYTLVRRVLDGEQLAETHPMLPRVLARHGLKTEPVLEEIARTGRVRGLRGVPEHVSRLLPTAWDIAPSWHLRMQAVFQRHVHSAVSKTVNFPAAATTDDVARAYLLAWKEGCKGITVYRDGSRAEQVLTAGSEEPLAPEPVCPECR